MSKTKLQLGCLEILDVVNWKGSPDELKAMVDEAHR